MGQIRDNEAQPLLVNNLQLIPKPKFLCIRTWFLSLFLTVNIAGAITFLVNYEGNLFVREEEPHSVARRRAPNEETLLGINLFLISTRVKSF